MKYFSTNKARLNTWLCLLKLTGPYRRLWLDRWIPPGYSVYQAPVKDDLEEQDLLDGVLSCKVLGLRKRRAGKLNVIHALCRCTTQPTCRITTIAYTCLMDGVQPCGCVLVRFASRSRWYLLARFASRYEKDRSALSSSSIMEYFIIQNTNFHKYNYELSGLGNYTIYCVYAKN